MKILPAKIQHATKTTLYVTLNHPCLGAHREIVQKPQSKVCLSLKMG